MHIYFSRGLRIEAEGNRNFTIQRQHPKKGTWQNYGYYSKLDQACNAMLHKELCEGTSKVNAQTMIKLLPIIEKRIEMTCASLQVQIAHANGATKEFHPTDEVESILKASMQELAAS